MADAWSDAEERYKNALRAFLVRGDEASLERAYDIGRQLIGEGRGVVELTGIHGRALSSLPDTERQRAVAGQGARFLAEAMAPFEMQLRGFEELTRTLEERVEQRTKELESAQAMFHQAQKMETVGRLAGGVAHDFNNVLSVIMMNTEIALSYVGDDEELRGNLEEIFTATGRASSLTRQLLAFSRKQILQPTILDLNDVVRGLEGMLRRLIGENVKLTTSLNVVDEVNADKGQIEQVVMNLVVNARDAMPSGGTITIDTRMRGAMIELSVSDTGTGIPNEIVEHIFEPFFTTKPEGRGTGLGLATCYGIVKQSGGAIEVHSEVGKGTRFDVLLPSDRPLSSTTPSPIAALHDVASAPFDATTNAGRAAPASASSSSSSSSSPSASAAALASKDVATILLVDDDDAVRKSTARVLVSGGHDVTSVSTGAEAVALAKARRFDVLVTDVAMPGMGGGEVAESVKAASPSTLVLFISGYSDDEIVERGVRTTGADFLQKPMHPKELLAKIREMMARATSESRG